MTYEFTIFYGLGAAIWLILALAARAGKSWVPTSATAVFAVGTALSIYNFTQPHPLLMSITGMSPPAVGAVVVITLWRQRSQ